jgi:antirestriction protein ArdC
MDKNNVPSWEQLLESAVNQPGTLEAGFRNFHNYSFGNQILAMGQCQTRGLALGPIATFPKWKELGRHVKRGERAIMLCMPVTFKKEVETEAGTTEEQKRTGFAYRNNWFVLSQTEGQEYQLPELPEWTRANALAALNISEVPFEHSNGNVQGYARKRELAINPVATDAMATFFHELAHIVLEHTAETVAHDERLPRNLREVEAESVALLCIASLGIGDTSNQRGYIQNWLKGERIPEASAKRIFAATDTILKAGKAASA